jgi:2-polyprenyl-3-methyl-5-hydroxy-6-metoxy-1,4-benzoquinol methylase
VGCGFGITEGVLASKGKEVWGVELEPDAAKEAATRLSRVICGDAETAMNECPQGYFDCLIMADILEHLVDPWRALAQYKRKLREGGHLIVSLPNVRFAGTTLPLIFGGRWQYTDEGVLDRTHLRFFTRKTAIALVQSAGFSVTEVQPRVRQSLRFNTIVGAVQRTYYVIPIFQGFLAKQFIISAKCIAGD